MLDQDNNVTKKRQKRHWSWKRVLADVLIIAGLGLLAYPLGTWGVTWFEQRSLEKQLGEANPQMTAGDLASSAGDFIPADVKSRNAQQNAVAAAAAAAEAEHQAQLAAFREAAAAYAAKVSGKTGEPIGRILIPSIELDVIMVEGAGKADLKEGPGHWPETPFPGLGGNFVVSGHRTTYGAPFMKLNKVKVGDEIDVVLPYVIAKYTVTRVIIVLPDQVEEVAQRGKEQISLAACHPLYSAKQRIVVQGDLASFKLLSSTDQSTTPAQIYQSVAAAGGDLYER